jgi:hypothetical protein
MQNPEEIKIESALVLDCLDLEIMIISKDFKIIYANLATLEKLKIKKDDIIDKYCYAITHHKDSPCGPPYDPCPIAKINETGDSAVETHTHADVGGNKKLVNVTAAPFKLNGKIDAFIHLTVPTKIGEDLSAEIKRAMEKTQEILMVVSVYQEQVNNINRKTSELEETKKTLETKINELEIFNKLAVDRELKMIELKHKLKELESRTALT